MNCINCYHYDACASVDVTGYVADFEHEEECEHFKTAEDVHPTAHWVRVVTDYGSGRIYVEYRCTGCGVASRESLESFAPEAWYGYFKDRYDSENKGLHRYCPVCGAEMDFEKTDHSNHYVIRNRENDYGSN